MGYFFFQEQVNDEVESLAHEMGVRLQFVPENEDECAHYEIDAYPNTELEREFYTKAQEIANW